MSELGIRLWMRMLTHLRVLLGGMLAEVYYLVLRWDRLNGIIIIFCSFLVFVFGEIWTKYIDGVH